MKKFSQFLAESIRNYEYSVKLSFKPDNDTMTKIEQALSKYTVVNISAVKSTPIRRTDTDFPGINSPEIYMFTVEVAYPASEDMIRHTIANVGLELEQVVCKVTASHDESVAAEEAAIARNTGEKALLQTDYEGQDNKAISAENFGGDYNEKLVKNSIIGSTQQIIPKDLKKHQEIGNNGKTLNDIPTGDNSAVGSKKVKKPDVKSFAR